MSGFDDRSRTTDETINWFKAFVKHYLEHAVYLPVKIKEFHDDCEMCRSKLRNTAKKSDKNPGASLRGDPDSTISYSTILCFLGKHDECCRDYVLEIEQIEIRCLCKCHENTLPSERKRGKAAGGRSMKGSGR